MTVTNDIKKGKTIYLIGCASGIAGADVGSGDGPIKLEASAFLQEAQKKLQSNVVWEVMLEPSPSSLPIQETITTLYTQLAKSVSECIQKEYPCLIVGGDHSCAIGTWSGVYDALHKKGEIGLIWIDAHMDSHTPQTSLSQNIHGMPLACLLGHGYKNLINLMHANPKFKAENVCLIGVRSFESGEAKLLEELNVRIFYMDEVKKRGLATVLQEAKEYVSRNAVGFGVSLDLDGIDPLDAPGVDVPEKDGIRAQALCDALPILANDEKFITAEIVEFDPKHDKENKTEKLAIDVITLFAQGLLNNKFSK